MLVVCGVNTDTTDPDVVTNNMYQKSSTGKDFPPVNAVGDDVDCSSSTKLSLVSDAVFSNTIHDKNQYWVSRSPGTALHFLGRRLERRLRGACPTPGSALP